MVCVQACVGNGLCICRISSGFHLCQDDVYLGCNESNVHKLEFEKSPNIVTLCCSVEYNSYYTQKNVLYKIVDMCVFIEGRTH